MDYSVKCFLVLVLTKCSSLIKSTDSKSNSLGLAFHFPVSGKSKLQVFTQLATVDPERESDSLGSSHILPLTFSGSWRSHLPTASLSFLTSETGALRSLKVFDILQDTNDMRVAQRHSFFHVVALSLGTWPVPVISLLCQHKWTLEPEGHGAQLLT